MAMIKINLLPEAQRKPVSAVEQFHRTPIMWIAFGIVVAIPLLVWAPIGIRQQALRQISAKIQALEPKKKTVDQLQRMLTSLRKQEAAFEGLGKGVDRWAERLNILSDATPNGVWFTDLTLEPKGGLVIQGSAIGQTDPGMVSVTRLVQGLKASPIFTSAVKDIQIESISRTQDGEIEVVRFLLKCPLTESPSS